MVRDFQAEKRIQFVSWWTWKLGAIFMALAGLFMVGFAAYRYLGKTPQNIAQEAIPFFLVGSVYLIMAFPFWKTGQALSRFRPWARWLTVAMYVASIIYIVVYSLFVGLSIPKMPQGQKMIIPIAIVLVLYGLLIFVYVYFLKCLLDRRACKVFSQDYRHRLQYNSFDKIALPQQNSSSGDSRDTMQAFVAAFMILLVVVAVIGIIAAIAIPNLIQARKAANEASALGMLRGTYSAQEQFRILRKATDSTGKSRYALSYEELAKEGLLTAMPSSGTRNGYRFKMVSTQNGQGFYVIALPEKQGVSGNRGFYLDESGKITYSKDGSTPDSKSDSID